MRCREERGVGAEENVHERMPFATLYETGIFPPGTTSEIFALGPHGCLWPCYNSHSLAVVIDTEWKKKLRNCCFALLCPAMLVILSLLRVREILSPCNSRTWINNHYVHNWPCPFVQTSWWKEKSSERGGGAIWFSKKLLQVGKSFPEVSDQRQHNVMLRARGWDGLRQY